MVVCVCLNGRISYGALIQGPEDTRVVEGERVTLACETNLTNSVQWHFGDKAIFYEGKIFLGFESYFRINSSTAINGQYNLEIPKASGWYNGIYKCTDDEGHGEERSAWLNVTGLSSAINLEKPEMIQYFCIIICNSDEIEAIL